MERTPEDIDPLTPEIESRGDPSIRAAEEVLAVGPFSHLRVIDIAFSRPP